VIDLLHIQIVMETIVNSVGSDDSPPTDPSVVPLQLDEDKKFFVANMPFAFTPEQVKDWFTVRYMYSL